MQIKLKYINIYNYWLRKFVKTKEIDIKFIKTAIIFANRLIKAFLALKFREFKNLIGIKNILAYLKKYKFAKLIIKNFASCKNDLKKGFLLTVF